MTSLKVVFRQGVVKCNLALHFPLISMWFGTQLCLFSKHTGEQSNVLAAYN